MLKQEISIDLKKLNIGRVGITFAALFMIIGQLFLIVGGTLPSGPFDGFVQLLPWVLIFTIMLLSFWISEKVGLGILCAVVAMMLNLALNFLLAIPILVGNTRVVWEPDSARYLDLGFSDDALLQIANGKNSLMVLGDVFLWVGSILALIFSVVVFLGLRKFLTGPARKSSFSIDIAALLVILVMVTTTEFFMRYSFYTTSFISFLLMTYLPLLLWLSFTLRKGGVVAIGSSSGFVGAVFLIPTSMAMLTAAFGGSTASYVTSDGSIGGRGQNAYDVLNPMGVFSSVTVVSLLLLLVVLWWNFGTYSNHYLEERVMATTSSKVNSLSVLSFILSWIPLTAIPANVLGHMAYDQVLNDRQPQRGLGLSRAAIILSYLTMAAGAFAIYTIWFN